jgi:hypothetical protein
MATFNKALKEAAKRKPIVRLDTLEPPAPEAALGVTKAPEVAPPSEPGPAIASTGAAKNPPLSEVKAGVLLPETLPKPPERTLPGSTSPLRRETMHISDTIKRDGFGFPLSDYKLLEQMIDRCMRAGCKTNKSEIVRAGLRLLAGKSTEELVTIIGSLERLKPGPKRSASSA